MTYDHPSHTPLEHALNIDFVNPEDGLDARIPIELSPESARGLVEAINTALERGKGYIN